MAQAGQYEDRFLPREGEGSAEYARRMESAVRAVPGSPAAKRDKAVALAAKAVAVAWNETGMSDPFAAPAQAPAAQAGGELQAGIVALAHAIKAAVPVLGAGTKADPAILDASIRYAAGLGGKSPMLDRRKLDEARRIADRQVEKALHEKNRQVMEAIRAPFAEVASLRDRADAAPESQDAELLKRLAGLHREFNAVRKDLVSDRLR